MQTERQQPSMSADDVRKAIRQLEIGVVNYRGRGESVLDLLAERDRVEASLAALETAGLDVRPERTRLAFVDGKIEQYSRKLIREMGGAGVLERAREERQAPPDHWWWFLDLRLAERLRKSVRRMLITLGVIVALVGGGLLLADHLWGLSPEEKQAYSLKTDAERLIAEGDIDTAITTYQQAVELTPEDAEAWLYLGMLYRETGQTQQADEAFEKAVELMGHDEVEFYVDLAQAYVIYGDPQRVVESADAALALDDRNARAYYVRATGYELQNEVQLALEDLDRSAELSSGENDALYVMAKTRYANLLERAAAQP